ncbi:hypothetical protein C1645_785723 [Glomus cerebriforme]|uniref:Uncharacterized protein n=1 Tax=Glomus cerebriforme TaxID=658196 RepID=A0A397SI99_9GLOM|nr:hypothetical protein C1645_785723 [Glomus cerebriforme]
MNLLNNSRIIIEKFLLLCLLYTFVNDKSLILGAIHFPKGEVAKVEPVKPFEHIPHNNAVEEGRYWDESTGENTNGNVGGNRGGVDNENYTKRNYYITGIVLLIIFLILLIRYIRTKRENIKKTTSVVSVAPISQVAPVIIRNERIV